MKIKQKLLTSAALVSSLCAGWEASAAAGRFYLSVASGLIIPNKISSTTIPVNASDTVVLNYSKKTDGVATIAFGYNILDDLKAELEYVKPFFDDISSSAQYKGLSFAGTIKPSVNAVYLKLYYDALKIQEHAKVYLGVGAGTSTIKSKYVNIVANSYQQQDVYDKKTKINFSYLLALGASFDINANIAIGVEYNYLDFGKSNSQKAPGKNENMIELANKKFAGHAALIKLRFCF